MLPSVIGGRSPTIVGAAQNEMLTAKLGHVMDEDARQHRT
jgi:hypothetical protein